MTVFGTCYLTCRSLPPQVPFLDVLGDMTDPDLPLTQVEYEDWGNPSCPDDAAATRNVSRTGRDIGLAAARTAASPKATVERRRSSVASSSWDIALREAAGWRWSP